MMPKDFSAVLTKIINLTENTKSFYFEFNKEDFSFHAGQFVMTKFADPDAPATELQRAYSIANRPGLNYFEICLEFIPNGKGSRYFSSLQVGDNVKFKGPFGMCYIKEDNKNDLVMIATGTGIAPIKSILEDMSERGDKRRIDVFFGVRHESNLFYVEELNALSKINYTLSQPQTPDWKGLTGRVTEHIKNFDLSHNPDFYICGNNDMIMEIREIALSKGIDRKKIHVEIFD